ncbi:MAG TPA: helix-turn-helix domain-containing protein [Candidatus Acidoferrales bacterium]|nr:helix-turn-helix domain-containing protein [Candidatus Acidoferrales bacterium]
MARTASPATSGSRRERRVREVHDRIVAAAIDQFTAHGVESVKIDAICHAADIAQKTFFNHFPTKQHLLREIAEGFLRALLDVLDAARRDGGTTAQQLERFFALVATEVERGGPMHRSFVMEVIRLVHDDPRDLETNRQLYDAFGTLLRAGVRTGDTTTAYPVAVLSEIVVGTFNTLMLNWLGIENYPFRARATAMAHFLADALRARKGLVAAKRKISRLA